MREHMGLFRGKRKDNGEWVEGVYMPAVDNDPPYIFRSPKYTMGYEVDPDTVGECTGLKDKNGKLIFEGDIVQYYGTYALEVFIEEGHAKTRWFDTVTNSKCVELFFGYDEEALGEVEIIGNIHDNPELLKGGEGNG